ncbi:MAG: T9SS type A sorting domain-containing protein, partial [Vicingaceae bacterium]|nr:T9SS type A sorting domain-containing protein [Vicingaceae bacterium]
MKEFLLSSFLLITTLSFFAQGPYAPPAGQTGSTAIHKDSSVFVTWASSCTVSIGPQDISNSSSGNANVGTNASAIGKSGLNGIVSLGDGGSATLAFNAPIINGQGADFAVFENSFSDSFLELAFVEVSSDGINFFRFDAISLTDTSIQTPGFGITDATDLYNLAGKYRGQFGTPFDLDELDGTNGLDINNISHVKIIDAVGSINPQYASYDSQNRAINDPFPTPFGSSGFDLDAVGVISSSATNIDAITENNNLRVYPNPASNVLNINLKEINQYEYTILNYNGKIIDTDTFNGSNHQINLDKLKAGVYFIQIKSDKT